MKVTDWVQENLLEPNSVVLKCVFFPPYKFKFLEFKYPPQLDLQKEDNWIIFLLYIFMA